MRIAGIPAWCSPSPSAALTALLQPSADTLHSCLADGLGTAGGGTPAPAFGADEDLCCLHVLVRAKEAESSGACTWESHKEPALGVENELCRMLVTISRLQASRDELNFTTAAGAW